MRTQPFGRSGKVPFLKCWRGGPLSRAGAGFSRNVGAIRREGKYVATKVDGNAVETLVKGSPAQRDVLEVLHVLRYPNARASFFVVGEHVEGRVQACIL